MVRACASTTRRRVERSGTMSRRPTVRGRNPNVLSAILGARRSFASRTLFVSSSDPNSDFTSETAIARAAPCPARMSIEPRSPNSEYDTSTAVVHPRAWKTARARSTIRAWASSRSRSAIAPFQNVASLARPSTASKIRRVRSSATTPTRPASISMTSPRGTPARSATAACVMPDRRRIARSRRPTRSSSADGTCRTVPCGPHLALTQRVARRPHGGADRRGRFPRMSPLQTASRLVAAAFLRPSQRGTPEPN